MSAWQVLRLLGRAVPVLALLLAACDFPNDSAGTLDRVEGGELRVGVTLNPPWVADVSDEPAGIEPDLVRQWAKELGARVTWIPGSEARLVQQLKESDVDLVIGGLTEDSPWAAEVGFTQAYVEAPDSHGASRGHVMAVGPGENAMALALDRFLHESAAQIAATAP